jgi:hypothetical protein
MDSKKAPFTVMRRKGAWFVYCIDGAAVSALDFVEYNLREAKQIVKDCLTAGVNESFCGACDHELSGCIC